MHLILDLTDRARADKEIRNERIMKNIYCQTESYQLKRKKDE